METRAHHVLIGSFTIATVILAFLFVAWLGKIEWDRTYAYYEVIFDDSVSGLSIGGPVRYQGIPVGEVVDIYVDPQAPEKVHVLVQIQMDDSILIRRDAKASLEYQGVTGVAYIQIFGGSPGSEILPRVSEPDGPVPEIETAPSSLQSIFANLPETLSQAVGVLRRIESFLSPENEARFSGILANLETTTQAVASREEEIATTLDNFAKVSADVAEAIEDFKVLSGDLRETAARANVLIDEDLAEVLAEFDRAAEGYTEVAQSANRILVENEDEIASFTQDGLGQFGLLVTEARDLVRSLDRVATRLENNPQAFVAGSGGAEEYDPEDD